MSKEGNSPCPAEQHFEAQWFMVTCDKCGWKWYETEQMQSKRFFYCPKCLNKVRHSEKPPRKKKMAAESEIESLKKFFDLRRLDNR